MGKSTKRISNKTGLPPGALIHVGEQISDKVKMSVIDYNKSSVNEKPIEKLDSHNNYLSGECVTWLNVDGVHDPMLMEEIGTYFGLHSLVLEDIMNTSHRPKIEEFENYLYFTLKMLHYNEKELKIESEQVSFVLREHSIISFQEKEGDIFNPIRERIRKGQGKVREKKTDYLSYLLMDIVIDNYYTSIEHIGNRLDDLEDVVLENPPENFLSLIQELKRELIIIRKSIYPLRESIGFLEKRESRFIDESTRKYFRDVHDHTISIIDSIESDRDMLSSIRDSYLSNISNKMNNTMKVLTVMSSIFIPLTFIAGVYGTNFDNIPELHIAWAYPAMWGVMILITIGMIILFKKKKWL